MGHYSSAYEYDEEQSRKRSNKDEPVNEHSWPFISIEKATYDNLLDRVAQLEQLQSKPFPFEVNGQMLAFRLGLDDSHQSNLAIICNGVYIVGITPDGKLARYVTYPTDGDAFQVNKEGQVKIDKDNFY